MTARKDFGLADGDRAGFGRYLARRQDAGPTRTDLLPLSAAEDAWLRAWWELGEGAAAREEAACS